ncbi:replication protein A 70 kDa DNA-binding subunit B [Tanacetum coccineum]
MTVSVAIVDFKTWPEKEEFDPNNHSIALFSPVKKEVTADEFFKGAIKKMVGSIRDSDSSFHCILSAKIHKIHHEFRWTYLACKRCGRSAKEMDQCKASSSGTKGKKENVWNYRIHKALNAFGVGMRFKVNVRVIDVSGSASLLLFDDWVFKLGGEQCYNLIKKYGENHDEYLPDELNVLVGKRLLWRFHYTDEHIINNNYVYQVKLLSKDEDWITIFKKDFITEAYLYHPHLN